MQKDWGRDRDEPKHLARFRTVVDGMGLFAESDDHPLQGFHEENEHAERAKAVVMRRVQLLGGTAGGSTRQGIVGVEYVTDRCASKIHPAAFDVQAAVINALMRGTLTLRAVLSQSLTVALIPRIPGLCVRPLRFVREGLLRTLLRPRESLPRIELLQSVITKP